VLGHFAHVAVQVDVVHGYAARSFVPVVEE
jgi:hypothetical protein